MQSTNYSNATVLLFDQNSHVRRQTMSALNDLGFNKSLEYPDLTEVRDALESQRFDIVVLELDTTDFGVLALVKDIRRQRCGIDPFIPILLTTWDAKLKIVRRVLNSGADDVFLRPFSTAQLSQRIEAIVRCRKPFVVTKSYFGPDRRESSALRDDPTSIVVPNALQARVLGQIEAAPNSARIEFVLSQLRRLKLCNSAQRIWYLANRLKEALPDPSLPDYYESELAKIRNSIQNYIQTLAPEDAADLPNLCNSLDRVLSGLIGRRVEAKGLELLE